MPRVALIYPEVYDVARFHELRKEFPPFGVLYLAAILERDGYEVSLLAATSDIVSVDLSSFDAIGVSIASSATVNLLANYLSRATIDPETKVAAGGVHATFYPDEVMTDLPVDMVCYEEADLTISSLIEVMIAGHLPEAIPGMLYRRDDGTVGRTPPSAVTAELDSLPMPARHLLPKSDIIMTDRLAGYEIPIAHVMFSRGCPYSCAYCAAGNTPIRYRSGASARAELEELATSFGIEGFALVDDNFIVRRTAVLDICREVRPLGLKWSALSRVDTVNRALLDELAASGCVEIKYGIESGSEWLLRQMKKQTRLSRIIKTVNDTVDAGIKVKAFVIHGYPGETLQTTRETIALLSDLSQQIDRVSLFRFVPLPGTSAYTNFLELGIRGTHLDRRRWDGDWSKFHIHHNDRHWWGSDDQFAEVSESFEELNSFVLQTFGDR